MMGSAVTPAPMTWKAKALSGHHIGATQVAAVGAFTDQVVFPWASENSQDWGDLFSMNIYYCLVSSIMKNFIYYHISLSIIIYYSLLFSIISYCYILLSIIIYCYLLLSIVIYCYLLLSIVIYCYLVLSGKLGFRKSGSQPHILLSFRADFS